MAETWGSSHVAWSDLGVSWDGTRLAWPFQLGVDVKIGAPADMWALGIVGHGELDSGTRLAATADVPGVWLPLDCDLVEVSWQSGATGKPPHVLARPDPGTSEIVMVDPDLSWLPPGEDPQGGLRPGRQLRIVDRADGRVLWTGWLETLTWDRGPADPLHHLRLTAVDTITVMVNGPHVSGLPVQTAAARAAAVLAYRPEIAATIDPAATYTVAPADNQGLWEALVDAADAEIGYLWVGRDGSIRLIAHEASLTDRTAWPIPDCATVRLGEQSYDLMDVGNSWTVTRRKHDDTDTPAPQHASNVDAVSVYGEWVRVLDDWPAADEANTLRAAALGATAKGWPLAAYGAVAVDVAASRNDPPLIDLVRMVELGDRITGISATPGPAVPALLVVGWSWTWSAAGALAGELRTMPPPSEWGNPAARRWLLAVPTRSELALTTVLGG